MNFKENFKKQREKLNMTQEQLHKDLQKYIKISLSSIKDYEQGLSKPNLDKLEILYKYFKCNSYDDLLK